jgi:hypothetical protein
MRKGLKHEIVGDRHLGVYIVLGQHVPFGLYSKESKAAQNHRVFVYFIGSFDWV